MSATRLLKLSSKVLILISFGLSLSFHAIGEESIDIWKEKCKKYDFVLPYMPKVLGFVFNHRTIFCAVKPYSINVEKSKTTQEIIKIIN